MVELEEQGRSATNLKIVCMVKDIKENTNWRRREIKDMSVLMVPRKLGML